ncbi:MAG TPA: hypothetical protein VII29_15095 [Terriglobales bacterium]
MPGTQEKDGEVLSDLLQAGADGDLFVAGESGTHNGQMIALYKDPPENLIDHEENIDSVASLGEDIRTRTQARNVPADSEDSVKLRVV